MAIPQPERPAFRPIPNGLSIIHCPVTGCQHAVSAVNDDMGRGMDKATQALTVHIVGAHYKHLIRRQEAA